MYRVIRGYKGGVWDREITELYNRCSCFYYSPYSCRIIDDPSRLSNTWFNASWFNPSDFLLIVSDDRLYGYGFSWISRYMGNMNFCIDPYLSLDTISEILDLMIYDAINYLKHKAKNPIYKIYAGREYGLLDNLLKRYDSPLYVGYSSVNMYLDIDHYRKVRRNIRVVENLVIREASLNDIDIIAEIYNEAFRHYPWFIPWSSRDVLNWYKYRNVKAYLAYLGDEPVGYCDYSIGLNYYGEEIVYIETLAVKPKYWSRGIGSTILLYVIDELLRRGFNKIFLDGEESLSRYYYRRGFKPLFRYKYVLYTL